MSLLLFCPMGQRTRRVPALGISHGREPYRARKTTDGRQPGSGHEPDRRRSNCFYPAHEVEHCFAGIKDLKG